MSVLVIGNLDDVITILGLHRLAYFTDLYREGGVFELRHHLPAAKEAQITAVVLAPGVGRVFLGQFGEVSPIVQFIEHFVRRIKISNKDVRRAHLFRLFIAGDVLLKIG